jgi:hypothetical protein
MRKIKFRFCSVMIFAIVFSFTLFSQGVFAEIFTVTNTNDLGPGSFRKMVNLATAAGGHNRIHFDLPSGSEIVLRSDTIRISHPGNRISIDGTGKENLSITAETDCEPVEKPPSSVEFRSNEQCMNGLPLLEILPDTRVDINNLTLKGAKTGSSGGAIVNRGSLHASNVVFINNQAEEGGSHIYNLGRLFCMTCLFKDGYSNEMANDDGKGGAVLDSGYLSNFSRCVFMDNKAVIGGAVYSASNTSFTNCTFYKNIGAKYGGALFINYDGGKAECLHCTFCNNLSSTAGYDVYIKRGTLVSRNSIFWGKDTVNNSQKLRVRRESTGGWTRGSCLIQGLHVSMPNISGDPKFVDPTQGDLRLRHDSPCINMGNNSFSSNIASDLYGNVRKVGPRVDIGAIEHLDKASTGVIPLTKSIKKTDRKIVLPQN